MVSKDLAGQNGDDPVPAGQGISGQIPNSVFISSIHCFQARPSCLARKWWIHGSGYFIYLYASESQEEVACVLSPASTDGVSFRR